MSNATAGDDANVTGDLDITGDVTIIGAGLATTRILGNGADRLFDIFPGVNATIIGVQIADGVSPDNGARLTSTAPALCSIRPNCPTTSLLRVAVQFTATTVI